jgi:hypothetical protein
MSEEPKRPRSPEGLFNGVVLIIAAFGALYIAYSLGLESDTPFVMNFFSIFAILGFVMLLCAGLLTILNNR